VRESHAIDLDLWLMDDPSGDGTRGVVDVIGLPWVYLMERRGPRGLSEAVIEGLRTPRGRRLVVMDAELSHPAAAIPAMLEELDRGAEFAFGSRYVHGGDTEAGWGALRWLNSKVVTLLARPSTSIRDPMSGFFALDRARLHNAATLDPVGYKIGMALLVKSRASKLAEVPIHFANRVAGMSKLTLRQQRLYLEHLRRLYKFNLFGR